jgi:putative spermidine/putrescine transport system permease protein
MRRDWRRPSLNAVAGVIGFFLVAPTLIVVPMSFSSGQRLEFPPPGFSTRWYANFFHSSMWTDAAITSVKVALLTVLVATALGTLTALGLVRGRFPGKALVQALVLSPAIVPVVIVAIGTFFVFIRWRLAGTLTGLVLAHTALALPLVVVTVGTSLRTLDRNIELAAQSLGAGPWRTFWRITFPLILPGIIAGALFAFVTSWDEVVVAIFMTSPLFRTLPVVMWSQVRSEIDPTIAAVASLLMAITVLALVLVVIVRWRASLRTAT